MLIGGLGRDERDIRGQVYKVTGKQLQIGMNGTDVQPSCRGQPGQARTLRAGKAEVQPVGNAFFKHIQMLGQSQHGLHHVQVMNLRWVDSYQCIGQKVGLLLVVAFQTYSISYL